MTDEEIEEQRERLLDAWEAAAAGWGRQADRNRETTMPVSTWMLSHAGLGPGIRVLELAAGPGDTGFMAAERIKPGGQLISSDGTEAMLDVARERAQEQGVQNVEFRQLQLEWIDLATADVDVVLCRWGVMLTLDPATALHECRRVLKPGGRLCIAVWDRRERNPWVTVCEEAMTRLGFGNPPAPGAPGMFALAADGVVQELLADAGFQDIVVEPIAITQRYSSVTDYIGQTRDLSRGFRRVWDDLLDADRQRVRDELTELISPYQEADGQIVLPGSSLGVYGEA